jgi:hypothetical protein
LKPGSAAQSPAKMRAPLAFRKTAKQTPVGKNFVRYAGLLSSPYEKTILERKALDNCLGLPRSLSLPDFLERRFEAA